MDSRYTPSEIEMLQYDLRHQARIVETTVDGSLTHEIAKLTLERLKEELAKLQAK